MTYALKMQPLLSMDLENPKTHSTRTGQPMARVLVTKALVFDITNYHYFQDSPFINVIDVKKCFFLSSSCLTPAKRQRAALHGGIMFVHVTKTNSAGQL